MSDTLLFANNASTTLAGDITTVATTFALSDGSVFPDVAGGNSLILTLDNGEDKEIILVTSKSGNLVSDCTRGYEGTDPVAFLAETLVENRPTAGTLASFARLQDRMGDFATLAVIPRPSTVTANSVLVQETDAAGNPVLALAQGNVWRFPGFPETALAGTVASQGNQYSFSFDDAVNLDVDTGKYIIQFKTGLNVGLPRFISGLSGTTVSWNDALPAIVDVGDTFDIYKSSFSTLEELQDPANAFSLTFDPTTLFEEELA